MNKILIIQTAFIGDVILATSLIEQVRKEYPKAQIDFVLRKGNQSLLAENPHIHRTYVWDKSQKKIWGLLKILKQIRQEKYDVVLNIQRFMNAGLLTAFSGAPHKIGFHSNPLSMFYTDRVIHKIPHPKGNEFLHEVQRNYQLLLVLINKEIPEAKKLRPKLYLSAANKEKVKSFTPGYVLAPSSVWFTKQWDQSKWKELILSLGAKHPIYLIGGPDDGAWLDTLFDSKQSHIHNLAGKLSLTDSAALMKNALRVFVNDSAPLHLASSVNAKTTAIFCSTVPDFGYFPLSDDSIIIQRDRLECMPCGLHGKKSCPLGHFKCALDIETTEVLSSVK